jgi:small conductance mechanosensitive channel
MNFSFADILQTLTWERIAPYVNNFFLAVATIVIGLWAINRIVNLLKKALERSSVSVDIIPFFVTILNVLLKVLLLFSVAELVGIGTTSFVAILGAATLAIGLALQGSLGNLAAGVVILLFKPFRVGEWIEVDENFGKVEEIQIFHTYLASPGNKTLILPNGEVINNTITNFSRKGSMRIELEMFMPYSESYPKVERIIREVLETAPNVLKEPIADVGIIEYDTHYIVLGIRPYIHPDNFWNVKFDLHKSLKNAFYRNNIQMAYAEGVELGNIGE